MGRPDEPYVKLEVESYRPSHTSGLHGPVHIRPVAGQDGFPPHLHVRCSKKLSRDYPVGTRFLITAKLSDREGGGEFVESYYGWPFEVLWRPDENSN